VVQYDSVGRSVVEQSSFEEKISAVHPLTLAST
jgi:hypothetical protein